MAGARDDLQFLAMFHYAVGAMACMVSLVPALGLFVVTSLTPEGQPIDALLVRLFGERGAAFAAGFLLVALATLGGLLIAAGLNLMRLRNHRFCVVASTLGCLFDPWLSRLLGRPEGTVLTGVLALIAVFAFGTAIYRTAWIAARLRERPPSRPGSMAANSEMLNALSARYCSTAPSGPAR